MKFELTDKDVKLAAKKVRRIHKAYILYFHSKTRSVDKQLFHYLNGIFLEKGRGNMCNYAKNVPGCNNQSLQHFISNSEWDERPVIDQIQRDVAELIGSKQNGAIHVDESAFPKSGKYSVGVSRQYCGRLGKIQNCQVGVFLGYTNKSYRTLIDESLYIPENWIEDQKRREKCGIPEEIEFKTKNQLALEMIFHARDNGVTFAWVGMDSAYGRDSKLRNELDKEGLIFIADIPNDTKVWLTPPKTSIPVRKGNRGPNPKNEKVLDSEPKPIMVRELKDQLDDSQWDRVFVRDTEREKLYSNIACIRVYPVVDKLPGDELWLIIRKNDGEQAKTKYQFSNAPSGTSVKRLVQMSHSRFWIERAFEDGKGIAGLADYQVRSWTGWHHHITVSLLAMLVILMLNIDMGEKAPLLTVQDVKEILEVAMPKKEITEKEIIDHIEDKQRKRESAKRSHHKRNN